VGPDAGEHVGEVLERVLTVSLAGGDEGVEPGDVVAGVLVADEEEVLPPMRSSA
jgi:hypothetical protein